MQKHSQRFYIAMQTVINSQNSSACVYDKDFHLCYCTENKWPEGETLFSEIKIDSIVNKFKRKDACKNLPKVKIRKLIFCMHPTANRIRRVKNFSPYFLLGRPCPRSVINYNSAMFFLLSVIVFASAHSTLCIKKLL